MPPRPLAPSSLARRFAISAAALATAALLLVTLTSWWLVNRQHEQAVRELERKEADFHAATIGRTLHSLAQRMAEISHSTILATGLVDSAGKETYLTPYLTSIRQVNGVPIEILFTDFEGQEIARNGPLDFSPPQIEWLLRQLQQDASGAVILEGPRGPELVAVELLRYARTPTPEGAVLYKVALADLLPAPNVRLVWNGAPPYDALTHVVRVSVPPAYEALGLYLVTPHEVDSSAGLQPHYLTLLLIAAGLAAAVFIVGSRLALSMTADLRRLERFASSVVRAGFGRHRTEESGSAEVASLARAINHMLDRLHEQHALVQQETHKLHQLASTIPQLAWIAHPDGRIHWYNERWYIYTGSTPGATDAGLWSRTSKDAAQRLRTALDAGQPFQMTIPLRGADGELHPFFTSAAPLRDADGRIAQWFGTNTDLSPLERAEQAVRESDERLREGLSAAHMAVWDWDVASRRISFAANTVDVFGTELRTLEDATRYVHPDDVQPLRSALDRALADCDGCAVEVRIRRPGRDGDEYGWIDVHGRVACDELGRPLTVRGVTIDITQRKQAEEALVAAGRRKDDFLAMLAHELRNPLAPITTAAEIMQHIPIEPRMQELSQIIARQAGHMNNLVDDLLDVSRVTRGVIKLEREPVPLRDIVAGAVEQVRGLIDARRHALTLDIEAGDALVYADRTRMVQVVANLLNNAAKYTPEGGQIALQGVADAESVEIRVRDNGIGIVPELLPHVFELFIQAERSPDRAQGGLGLGLTLVRSLTELHGGSVTARSEGVGKGSEFAVRLPRLPEQRRHPRAAGERPARPAGARRILVVDDNADAALSLALLLESMGHTVSTEYDARRALDRAAREAPEVVLLDIGLPEIDGYELARRLRAEESTRDALLIAVTGYGQPEDRARSKQAGIDHHLVKPVSAPQLADLLGTAHKT